MSYKNEPIGWQTETTIEGAPDEVAQAEKSYWQEYPINGYQTAKTSDVMIDSYHRRVVMRRAANSD